MRQTLHPASLPLPPCRIAALALLLGAVALAPVQADTLDTFYVTASVTHQHDGNLFRLPSNVDPRLYIGRSSAAEQITVTSVALNINKAYSLQRFELMAGFDDYHYRNFDYLDYTAVPYRAAWHWSLTPRVHGTLLTERDQSTTSFSDYAGYTKRNTKTTQNHRFNAEYDLGGAWHILGALAKESSENDEQTLDQDDFRRDATEIGVRYAFPSGSGLRYVMRGARGDYINRGDPGVYGLSDNGFEDREHALSFNWAFSGKTALDARIARFERRHDHYAVRDYDGVTGNLGVSWTPTGKTRLRASFARELASNQTFYSSYTETDRLTIAPTWQISSRLALRGQYDVARRDYLAPVALTSYNGRSDTLRTAFLALDWNPGRDLMLSLSGRRETRESNRSGLDYESNIVMLSANIGF